MLRQNRLISLLQFRSRRYITSFHEFKLNEALLSSLSAMQISRPTAVQAKSIPVIQEGKNVVITAPTGWSVT